VVVGLSLDKVAGRSAGRGDGLGELPFDRGRLEGDSVRGAFVGTPRRSSTAFRFGMASLGREALVGDGDGCSPVIDARSAPI
jgi:hypothetical protein